MSLLNIRNSKFHATNDNTGQHYFGFLNGAANLTPQPYQKNCSATTEHLHKPAWSIWIGNLFILITQNSDLLAWFIICPPQQVFLDFYLFKAKAFV